MLHDAVAHRQDLERQLAEAERALVTAARAVADRREGLAKLAGQVDVLRTRSAAAADEIARLTSGQRATPGPAPPTPNATSPSCASRSARSTRASSASTSATKPPSRAQASAEASVRELTAAEREAERERSTWSARREALALGLTRKDGAGAVLAAGSRLPGVLGSVAALLTVEAGHEAALAAALGAIADAVAVASTEDASAALELLKTEDAGRAGLLIGGRAIGAAARPIAASWPALPPGAVWARELVRGPARR